MITAAVTQERTRTLLQAYRQHFIGRTDVYAEQQADGSYRGIRAPLTDAVLEAHLAGEHSIATYFAREALTHHACLDIDRPAGGLLELRQLYFYLQLNGIHGLLESSRRGGHLWVSLAEPLPGLVVRQALRGLAYAAGLPLNDKQGRELYPKSDSLTPEQIGNPIRVPLGIHRKSNRRYPLVRPATLASIGATIGEQLQYVARVPLTPPERIYALRDGYPMPAPPPVPERETTTSPGGERPGDDFIARATWKQILEPHGWMLDYSTGDVDHWRRPHKEEGTSATTGYGGTDLLYVFSTSTPFESGQAYSKFAAYAVLNHYGNLSEAARDLRRQGYGARPAEATEGQAA